MDLMALLERALADAREQHPKTSDAVKGTSTAEKPPIRKATRAAQTESESAAGAKGFGRA
ncbi:hypothetical protein ABTX81_37910 [Kitasatospora sp. NPDC097605]|uniref:hypothetical protein n=1 Tax=Kitasatospora sp. NPDC097605 TaxID=3157226 RepID=UPI003333FBA1